MHHDTSQNSGANDIDKTTTTNDNSDIDNSITLTYHDKKYWLQKWLITCCNEVFMMNQMKK